MTIGKVGRARLYAPLAAVVVVQLLLVAFVPSNRAPQPETGSGPASGPVASTGKGDRTHCSADGRQTALVFTSPPCVPRWTKGTDNGGATYPGVTGKSIKVVLFREKYDAQVNAALSQQGLGVTDGQLRQLSAAITTFINKRYELYGRKVETTVYFGNCPTDTTDVPTCRADAQAILAMKPFLVIWSTSLYPQVFDDFARAGVISVGGSGFADRYYTGRRPFRYDTGMSGTRGARHVAEYYCRKLAGKVADHSGATIHPSIGQRGKVKRRLGIIVLNEAANLEAAKILSKQVAACDGEPPVTFTYEGDVTTAQQQSVAVIAGLVRDKVTTVSCLCDPITPSFMTGIATGQNYFPEWLLPVTGLLDYDLVGRLYDKAQWVHAFGPSELADPVPPAGEELQAVWHDSGQAGTVCGACVAFWAPFDLAGTMIQQAGPRLNPASVERGIIGARLHTGGWQETGNDPTKLLSGFGPGDYTGDDDAREVYWDPKAISAIDRKAGAYRSTNGGRRYRLGEWPSGLKIPVR